MQRNSVLSWTVDFFLRIVFLVRHDLLNSVITVLSVHETIMDSVGASVSGRVKDYDLETRKD